MGDNPLNFLILVADGFDIRRRCWVLLPKLSASGLKRYLSTCDCNEKLGQFVSVACLLGESGAQKETGKHHAAHVLLHSHQHCFQLIW